MRDERGGKHDWIEHRIEEVACLTSKKSCRKCHGDHGKGKSRDEERLKPLKWGLIRSQQRLSRGMSRRKAVSNTSRSDDLSSTVPSVVNKYTQLLSFSNVT